MWHHLQAAKKDTVKRYGYKWKGGKSLKIFLPLLQKRVTLKGKICPQEAILSILDPKCLVYRKANRQSIKLSLFWEKLCTVPIPRVSIHFVSNPCTCIWLFEKAGIDILPWMSNSNYFHWKENLLSTET